MTDSQSASLSSCQAPFWDLWPFFFLLEISCRQLRVCNYVAPSRQRGWVCKLLYNCSWAMPELSLLGRSPAGLTALFYCLIWDSTNLEGQVPVFQSHVSAVRNFQYYHWEGCMGSMQLFCCIRYLYVVVDWDLLSMIKVQRRYCLLTWRKSTLKSMH
jgi:hypothetical protein